MSWQPLAVLRPQRHKKSRDIQHVTANVMIADAGVNAHGGLCHACDCQAIRHTEGTTFRSHDSRQPYNGRHSMRHNDNARRSSRSLCGCRRSDNGRNNLPGGRARSALRDAHGSRNRRDALPNGAPAAHRLTPG